MSDAGRVVRVSILGTKYSVVSDRDEPYVQDLARYLDERLAGFIHGRSAPLLQSVILAALNIADELFRERELRRERLAAIETRLRRLIASLDDGATALPPPTGPGEEG